MKKNGFTLVELIATIALIALLATIILVNMSSSKAKQDASMAQKNMKFVENAGSSLIDSPKNNIEDFYKSIGVSYTYVDRSELISKCSEKKGIANCGVQIKDLIGGGLIDPSENDYALKNKDSYVWVWWVFDGTVASDRMPTKVKKVRIISKNEYNNYIK